MAAPINKNEILVIGGETKWLPFPRYRSDVCVIDTRNDQVTRIKKNLKDDQLKICCQWN